VKPGRVSSDVAHAGVPLPAYAHALDSLAIVAITDKSGKIIYANDQFSQISEYPKDELIGQDHRIINSGTHSRSFFKDMWKTILGGDPWKGEICNRAKSGRLYWVDTTIFPYSDPETGDQRFIAVRIDITVRKQAEADRHNSLALMIEGAHSQSMSHLAAAIGQQIMSPITIVSGQIQRLLHKANHPPLDANVVTEICKDLQTACAKLTEMARLLAAPEFKNNRGSRKSSVSEQLSTTANLCREKFLGKNSGG